MKRSIAAEVDGFTPLFDSLMQRYGPARAAVFGRVWRYCQGEHGACTASIETIARDLGISRSTTIRHVEALVTDGYLIDRTPAANGVPHVYADAGRVRMTARIAAEDDAEPVSKRHRGCVKTIQVPVSKRYTKREEREKEETQTGSAAGAAVAGAIVDVVQEGDTVTIANSARLDPIEHMLERQGGDRNERLLMRARGSETAKDFAVQFYREAHVPVVKASEWLSAAHELYEACGGEWAIASEALKRLRANPAPLTISSPRSLIKTAAAIRGERATKESTVSATVAYAPQFN